VFSCYRMCSLAIECGRRQFVGLAHRFCFDFLTLKKSKKFLNDLCFDCIKVCVMWCVIKVCVVWCAGAVFARLFMM